MDEAKHKAAIVGDLARLKSTWSKVHVSITREAEEKERAIQQTAEEVARLAREERARQIERVGIIHSAVARVMNECGPGFKFIPQTERDPSLIRIMYEPTGDELWVTERSDDTFRIVVMREDHECFAHDTQKSAVFTEEAIMTICLDLLLTANRKHVPSQEGRIL